MCNSTPKVHFNFPLNSHRNKFFDTRTSTLVCRSRRGRVRTVPSSRANSSKQSRVDPSESSPGGHQSKRSRSASEEPWDSSNIATSGLEIRGSESQIHPEPSSPSHQGSRPRRLTKVGIREREMRLSKKKLILLVV